jgi:signal recognition particle subunit SRP54
MCMATDFTLDDFRKQMRQLRQHGPLAASVPTEASRELDLESIERIIDAMTDEERSHPESIVDIGRQRIASASGTTEADVGLFLKQFKQLQVIMREMANRRRLDAE